MISETKLDESFHSMQLNIDRRIQFFRSNRNAKGGGTLMYVRDDRSSAIYME